MLIQLKNGTWIDPAFVTCVQSGSQVMGEGYPNGGVRRYVSIQLSKGDLPCVGGFSTDDEAAAYRDQLAEEIHAAMK